jgi:hypothetical protein
MSAKQRERQGNIVARMIQVKLTPKRFGGVPVRPT